MHIVGNPDMTLQEKHDLIQRTYGDVYVTDIKLIVQTAYRYVMRFNSPERRKEFWKKKVEELVGAMVNRNECPVHPQTAVQHVYLMGSYLSSKKRAERKVAAETATAPRKHRKAKSKAEWRAAFAEVAAHLAQTGNGQETLSMRGGSGKKPEPSLPRFPRQRREKVPEQTLVMGALLDQGDTWNKAGTPHHVAPPSPGVTRERLRRHQDAIDEENRIGRP